jgi:hypothetical protein
VTPFHDLQDYTAIPRVEVPRLSPDGRRLVAVVKALSPDDQEHATALWEIDPGGAAGPRRLTRSVPGEANHAFLPNGTLLFVSQPVGPDPQDVTPQAGQALVEQSAALTPDGSTAIAGLSGSAGTRPNARTGGRPTTRPGTSRRFAHPCWSSTATGITGPIGQAPWLWRDLVRNEVDAKFLYYPDENHWILGPGNAVVWYQTVLAFLARHVRGEPWRRPGPCEPRVPPSPPGAAGASLTGLVGGVVAGRRRLEHQPAVLRCQQQDDLPARASAV